jgi:hypothetical protein
MAASAALLALCAAAVQAQQPGRVATTPAAIRASAVFFHGKQVAVLGSIVESRGLYRLEASGTTPSASNAEPDLTAKPIYVYWRDRPTRTDGEVRGELWDLGRLTEGDSRFSNVDFRPVLELMTQGRWPPRDQLFVLLNASITEAVLPDIPSLRGIVLQPERFENRSATVSGRFRGRNLLGDIATPIPNPGKWDFVLQSADAAIWVTALRPRGQGFELDPSARVDTGRWLQVEGTVRREGSRVWIEGREIELAKPPQETVEVVVPSTPAEPPPTVIFSTPVPDEPDVDSTTSVRVQFSRDMDARSFKDRIRVSYQGPPQAAGQPPAPPPFSFNYNVGTRGIELKFSKPLERFQTVRVEFLEGITALGGDALRPWTLTFTTGR